RPPSAPWSARSSRPPSGPPTSSWRPSCFAIDSPASVLALADGHVHTEWSWDAARGDMEATCRKAVELGLPAIAFTDHCDFVHAFADQQPLDLAGYLESVELCRSLFPQLRVL